MEKQAILISERPEIPILKRFPYRHGKTRRNTGESEPIGKGEAFSAKIFNGKLQFTTPGLKDHSGEGMPLKTGSWVHLTYVYSQDKKIYFYVNGKPVDDILASELEQTNHSVLIGSNLWGSISKEDSVSFMCGTEHSATRKLQRSMLRVLRKQLPLPYFLTFWGV